MTIIAVKSARVATIVAVTVSLGACNTPVDPLRVTGAEDAPAAIGPTAPPPPLLSAVSILQAAYRDAEMNPRDTAKAQLFALSGIAVSDELCSSWFDALGRAQTNYGFFRDAVSNAGGLAAVLLKLSDAGSSAIAGAAAGTTFLTNTIDARVANYIVAPDLGSVKDTIDKSRAARAAEIVTAAPMTFPEAYSAVVRYDHSCSHIEIKRIIGAALKSQGDKAAGDKPSGQPPATGDSSGAAASSAHALAVTPRSLHRSVPREAPVPTRSPIRQLVPGLSPSID